MKKVTLSEISLITSPILSPKDFKIDRNKLKNDIIQSHNENTRIDSNPRSYAYKDYQIPYSQQFQWLRDYLRDHLNAENNKKHIEKFFFGNVFYPKEQSYLRNQVNPLDLKNSPDLTLLYIVDIVDNSCQLTIEYDDNRRKGRSWHVNIKNDHFYAFPSVCKYFISENKSNKINVMLTINYEFI